jgi:integrase
MASIRQLPSQRSPYRPVRGRFGLASSTAGRWRPVFTALDALPEPIANTAAAQRWLDSLKTADRRARTVREIWLSAARTVHEWGKRRGMVEVDPFDGCVVEVPRTKVTRETGRAFTEAEARTILHAAQRVPLLPIGTKGEQWAACRRWVPWLCAYTGARVGELTQLRAGDVQARQGPAGSVWVLRLTPDAGTIKTGRARTVLQIPAYRGQSFRRISSPTAPNDRRYRPSLSPSSEYSSLSRVSMHFWPASFKTTPFSIEAS